MRQKEVLKNHLRRALSTTDRGALHRVTEDLIVHIRASRVSLTKKDILEILDALRGVRRFDLLQRVSDTLIQCGQDGLHIRRHYAQSLLDQGNLTASIDVLNNLVRDSRNRDRREHIEAQGLLGRAFKQIYIEADGASGQWVANALKKSLRIYFGLYRTDPSNRWPGINAAALLQRARKDRIRVSGYPAPERLADDILDAIRRKKNPSTWDLATAAEACVALGRYDDALRWVHRYAESEGVSAFHLGAFERQLREVWELRAERAPGSRILPLVRRELLRREGATVDVSGGEIRAAEAQRNRDEMQLEKILGNTGVQSYRWWLTGIDRARGVARIGFDVDTGAGTGFVVRGNDLHPSLGEDFVLVTNAHVISDDDDVEALRPNDAVITFEASAQPTSSYSVSDVVFTSPPGELDATVVKLNAPIADRIDAFPLHSRLPAANRSRVYVIGHPRGGTLSFSIQDNLLIAHKAPRLHYRAPTEPGSSGSPVFNAQWKLIGLHHGGGHHIRRLDGEGTYAANEGIWIQSIREAMAAALQ